MNGDDEHQLLFALSSQRRVNKNNLLQLGGVMQQCSLFNRMIELTGHEKGNRRIITNQLASSQSKRDSIIYQLASMQERGGVATPKDRSDDVRDV